MTIQEASERYPIPLNVLHEYKRWGLCRAMKKVMGSWQYGNTDLERLSLIMTLNEILFREHRLRRPDCLCHEIRKTQKRE